MLELVRRRGDDGRPQTCMMIACSKCDRTAEIPGLSTKNASPDSATLKARQRFAKMGWRIDSRGRAVCPEHNHKLHRQLLDDTSIPSEPPLNPPGVFISEGTPSGEVFVYGAPVFFGGQPPSLPSLDEFLAAETATEPPPASPAPSLPEAESLPPAPAATAARPISELPNMDATSRERETRHNLSMKDKIRALDFLRAHLLGPDEVGFYRYEEGWSDAVIAEQIGNGASVAHIRSLRRAGYGKLQAPRLPRPKSNPETLEARMETLEKRLAVLEGAILGPD